MQGKGQRQKYRHAVNRTKTGQQADDRAHEAADQGDHQVFRGHRYREPLREVNPGIHSVLR